MRPCLFLVLPLAVLTGCGGSHRSTTETHAVIRRKVCLVHIYFSKGATHAQEQAVDTELLADPQVKRTVFVSKAQALAEMPKRLRKISKRLKRGNPLPDAYTVWPASSSDTRQVGASIKHAPGVATVLLTPCSKLR